MKRYPIHPAAKLMPPMTVEGFAELKADIKKHGLREPIVLYKGRLLDGIHRLRACQQLGIKPKTAEWDGKGDPTAYVVSLNIHRRHLTAGQRAILALRVLPLYKRTAKERQRVGGRHKGSAKLRQAGKATAKAAETVGVSARSVEMAKVLLSEAPTLARQVERGELSLGEADDMRRRRLPSMTKAQRAELVAGGDTVAGRLKIFANATIRQIKLAYGWEEHRDVVQRLDRILKQTKTTNPSEALLHLLAYWEKGHHS